MRIKIHCLTRRIIFFRVRLKQRDAGPNGAPPKSLVAIHFLNICLFLGIGLAFCSAAFAAGKDLAPPSPGKAWLPPGLDSYERELAGTNLFDQDRTNSVAVDPEKTYDLPELIDIAERSHPETRVAWEQARQAALAHQEKTQTPVSAPGRLRDCS